MASSSQHPADSHDLIRVQGARENNLKDVSVAIPKRRLTVFTGVSGSGKSSLVFGTIAAESQRLINETYSAFVQGFMPTLARPEVDVLDRPDDRDHRRPGADGRQLPLDGRHGDRRQRDAAGAVQPPRQAAHRLVQRLLLQRPVGPRGRVDHDREGRRQEDREAQRSRVTGGMCPRCEGMGSVNDIDLSQLYDDSKSLNEGALTIPGYTADGWTVRIFSGRGFLDPDKPIRKYTKKELHDFLYKEPTKVKVDKHQPDLRGADPADPEVVPVQGRRRDAAAHPGVRGARGHVHHLSRVRRHPAQRGRPVLQDQGDQHRRRLRDADQRPGRVGARSGRAVRRAAAGDAAADARLVRGDRAGLPQPRPAVRHAVGRRGAAHQDDPPPRVVAHRRDLRLRRADDRAAPPRHPADERPAAAAARQGQHRPRGRAQAGDDRDRRPRRRPRPRRRHRRRRGGLRGHRRRAAGQRHAHRASPERPGLPEAVGADAVGCDGGARRPHPQPAGRRRRHPARRAGGGDRRGRVGQELPDPRLGVRPGRGGVGRPGPDPRLAAEQPGDVHRPAGADPQGVREGQRREARPVQRQLRGRLPDLQRRRGDLHRPRR